MDGGDGWHVASFRGGFHKTVVYPVTMRFRPIAPKPAAGGSLPGVFSPENTSAFFRASKRVKRKYVRVQKDNSNPRRRSNRSSREQTSETDLNSRTDTLQLMPEKSDGYDSPRTRGSLCIIDHRTDAGTASSPDHRRPPSSGEDPDRTVVVESWVTVESVTDTCMDVREYLGRTDVEIINNLESDTCPGFVSDGSFRKVEWMNPAYKRMVVSEKEEEEGRRRREEMVVWFGGANKEVEEKLGLMGLAFTCRVRVQYYKRMMMKERCSKIMPCDVWRMECGGFAWRLDLKAALSLAL